MAQSRIPERCREVYKALLMGGCEGKIITRQDFERLLIDKWDLSKPTIRFYIDQGRTMGYWTLVASKMPKEEGELEFILKPGGPTGLLISPRESRNEGQIPPLQ